MKDIIIKFYFMELAGLFGLISVICSISPNNKFLGIYNGYIGLVFCGLAFIMIFISFIFLVRDILRNM